MKDNKLLESLFKNNEHLILAIRSLFYGWEVTKEDKETIKKVFEKEDVREAFRKKIFSKWGDIAPLGQIADQWINIPEDKLLGSTREERSQLFAYRNEVTKKLNHAMTLLENPEGVKPSLVYDENTTQNDTLGCVLLARNKYLNTIEAGLGFVYQSANTKELTKEQKAKLAKENSSK